MFSPRGAQLGPGGRRHGPRSRLGEGGGCGGCETATSGMPLIRFFLVPAEWVWPGLTSRSSLLLT